MHEAEIILGKLLEGTLDLGFIFETPQVAQLEAHQIANVPLILVSSWKDISATEAVQKKYVFVDWGLSFVTAHARHFPGISSPAIHLPLGRIALDYLLACGGSAYLAEPMATAVMQEGRLYRVADGPVIERSVYGLFPRDSERIELIQQALNPFTTNQQVMYDT